MTSGLITGFNRWQQVVRRPPDFGAKALEGEELEGELEPGELVWLDGSEQARLWAEEAEILALEAELAEGGAVFGHCEKR